MTIYNPVKKPSVLDTVREIYWNSLTARALVDGVFLLAGAATLTLAIVSMVPVR